MSDNPPAFPCTERRNTSTDPLATLRDIEHAGLSMRDWFAGQALVGLTSGGAHRPPGTADLAYQMADAMLKQRQRGQ